MGVLHMDLGAVGTWMNDEVVDGCLRRVAAGEFSVVEVAGDAPELHPRFREVVILARALRRRVVVPTRLAFADAWADFLAEQEVDVARGPLGLAFGPTVTVLPDGESSEADVSRSLGLAASHPHASAPPALAAGSA